MSNCLQSRPAEMIMLIPGDDDLAQSTARSVSASATTSAFPSMPSCWQRKVCMVRCCVVRSTDSSLCATHLCVVLLNTAGSNVDLVKSNVISICRAIDRTLYGISINTFFSSTISPSCSASSPHVLRPSDDQPSRLWCYGVDLTH